MSRQYCLASALLLIALFLLVPACGDDSTAPPLPEEQLPNLTEATWASVQLWVMGILVNRGEIMLEWNDFGTHPTPGAYTDSNQLFIGEEEIYETFTRDLNSVHLEFDRASGDITRLVSRREHANPSYSTQRKAAAHDIPLHSFTQTDSTWEAVWRLDSEMVCVAIDSVYFHHNRYVDEFLTWGCAGDEEAVLEVRVGN